MQLAYKSVPLEVKDLAEDGTFIGKLAVYGNIDAGGDVIDPGAFTKTLQEGARTLPLLWSHDTNQPIGVIELADSPMALLAKGKLVLSVQRAKEIYDLMRAGAVKGMSIGYRTIKQMAGEGGVRRLKELALHEGSLCVLPMNPLAQVTAVKEAKEVFVQDLETLQAFEAAAKDLREFREFHARKKS